MHIYKIPGFVRSLLPGLTWRIPTDRKEVYLTFDDGPVPGVTEWVLDMLDQFDAKASFFVVGDNVQKSPDLFRRIIESGHSVGNHTQNHLNAWQNSQQEFMNNIELCNSSMEGYSGKPLFRPPHGKLTPGIIRKLKRKYQIIMWDVLSGDYDPHLSAKTILEKSLKYTSEGSIIVFHDSYKAEKTLRSVLPKYLRKLKSHGFSFKSM